MINLPPLTAPVKRSVSIDGHRTSVSLEDPFWKALAREAVDRLGLGAPRPAGGAAPAAPGSGAQRVEITGSSIKRIDGETPLPVEVLRRADIEKIGVTTAAELLQKLTANVGGLTDGASITD